MQLRRTILALIIGLTGILGVPASSLAAVLPNAASGPVSVVVQVASADSAKLASRPSVEATFSEKTHIGAIGENQPETRPAYQPLAADSQQVALSKYLYDASGYTVAPRNITPASSPVGRKGAPLENSTLPPTRHVDEIVGGRRYTGHALDQAQNRGITPSVVEDAIKNGTKSPDPIPGRIRNYSPDNNITIITEGNDVITIIPGKR